MAHRTLFAALLSLLVSACGMSTDLFGGVKEQERSRRPDNATEYRCDENKRFYVRFLDGDAAAWVILPERQFRLDKKAPGEFANRTTRLAINGNEASLSDDVDLRFAGCKIPEKS